MIDKCKCSAGLEQLKRAMKEQNYDPQYAKGVLIMLEMNGYRIVNADDLAAQVNLLKSLAGQAIACLSSVRDIDIDRIVSENKYY